MDNAHNKIKGPILIIGIFVFLIASSAFLPASWFGVKPPNATKEYNLSMLSTEEVESPIEPAQKVEAWQALLQKNYSQDLAIEETPQSSTEVEQSNKRLSDPNNLTTSFTKNAYVASAYLKENNITDTVSQNEMINTLIEQERAKVIIKQYTLSDVHIAKVESTKSIKAYGNALGMLINKALEHKIGEDDLLNLGRFTETKDPTYLQDITAKKSRLNSIIKELLALTVPPSAASAHLLNINRISEYYTILDNFSQAEHDPIRATLSLKEYEPNLRALFGSINNMRLYFQERGVTFTKSEPGFVFSTGGILNK